MELKKTRRWLYISTGTWLVTTLALGVWWLYLVVKMAKILEVNKIPLQSNLYNMLRWEGLFFLCLLTILTITVFYLFYRDLKKSQAVQAFFASLTHELKTPLANIRMQSEILNEHSLLNKDINIQKNIQRLIQGSQELEQEFDKMLQLSRIEGMGPLNLHSVNLYRFLNSIKTDYSNGVIINIINKSEKSDVLVDDYALKVIINNLIQNSIKHNLKRPLNITFIVHLEGEEISLEYLEQTPHAFHGELKKLGSLFYKYDSHQGSGIGLYLIKKLMKQMKGRLDITIDDNYFLSFRLYFQGIMND